ncbi:MAG: T9SS type A sorting domain-containing protein [bacterium]
MVHTVLEFLGPDQACGIAYHMYWPSGSDPFYLYNSTDNNARRTYYAVNYVPWLNVDGTQCGSSQYDLENAINNRLAIASPLWMDFDAQVSGSNVLVNVASVANQNISGNYSLHVVMNARYTYLPSSPNGNPNHYNAMLDMFPSASGQAFSAVAFDTTEFTATFPMNPTYPLYNLDVVCFVQNNTTKEVLQAVYHQVPVYFPGLDITLTPINPPIEIPSSGGAFQYDITITNTGSVAHICQVWCNITLPTGQLYGPTLGPIVITVSPGATINRIRNQNIPGTARAGTYYYNGYVGAIPSNIWDQSSFSFVKLGDGDGSGVSNWDNWGDDFTLKSTELEVLEPSAFNLYPSYPNPFNPSTAISYQLAVNSLVSLRVYDTAGRLVETLVNGWREAGTHEATFDASDLPSGVYIASLRAGDFSATQKLVLLK